MSVLRKCACLSVLCLVVGAGVVVRAPVAGASRGEVVFFEAPRDLLSPVSRPGALVRLGGLGVRALRVVLYWHAVAPAAGSARRPGFDGSDPRAYSWGQYDLLVGAAQRLGWPVLLTVSGPVPRWATAARRDTLTRPRASEFRLFMTAVGRHFGSAVSLFSIWNEPNHPAFLLPQYVRGVPVSPLIYRGLFEAGYAGLKAAGLASPRVLMGETAPTGTGRDVAPLVFLRGALCLTSHYRKPSSCAALPVAGYAHHAYTKPSGPYYRPPNRDDVTIGVLPRLTRALDLAARAHALPARLPVYLTEFGIQSKPNPFLGVPVATQAQYDAIAEHIAWSNPRVASFSQYLLRDDRLGGKPGSGLTPGGFIGFQTGLQYDNGRPKPLYAGFPIPLTVTRHANHYLLWGLVRPANGPTHIDIQVQDPGSRTWHNLTTNLPTDPTGAWTLTSTHHAQHWRTHWTTPTGTTLTGPPTTAH